MKHTLATLLTIASTGCASTFQTHRETYHIKNLKIVCEDLIGIKIENMKQGGDGKCQGFINYSTSTIYVPWRKKKDMYGERLPDFNILGEEIWHRVKGDFHD